MFKMTKMIKMIKMVKIINMIRIIKNIKIIMFNCIQVKPIATKCNQVQPNATKCNKVQSNATKCNKVQNLESKAFLKHAIGFEGHHFLPKTAGKSMRLSVVAFGFLIHRTQGADKKFQIMKTYFPRPSPSPYSLHHQRTNYCLPH